MAHFVILSESIGAGHERAAIAIEEALLKHDPDVLVTRLNLLDTFRPLTAKVTRTLYLTTLARRPNWWGKWYEWHREKEWKGLSRSLVYNVLRKDVGKWLRQLSPDAVICTHPLPAFLIGEMKRQGYRIPIATVLTDFDLHGYWTHPEVDLYCVPLQSMADHLNRLHGSSRVKVTGIPISAAFQAEQTDCLHDTEREERNRNRVLIMGGGLGIGILPVVERIVAAGFNSEVTVVCGTNHALRQELQERYGERPHVKILGYTRQIAQLMASSDVLVTKPGGLTISEALAMKLPMVLYTPIQGQEWRNGQLMAEAGVALTADTAEEAAGHVQRLLEQRTDLQSMAERTEQIRRPHAAEEVATAVTEMVRGGHSVEDRFVYRYVRATS
jgi:processive 1,2-diacylglycerol beta-glucosyltransferase